MGTSHFGWSELLPRERMVKYGRNQWKRTFSKQRFSQDKQGWKITKKDQVILKVEVLERETLDLIGVTRIRLCSSNMDFQNHDLI